MKIPEFKRSGIRLFVEFCRIPNGFPNQGCRHLPSPSSSTTIAVHRCHLPPPQPSLPLRVSTIACCPLLSTPFVVPHQILHAVVVRHCHCLPSLSLSAAAVFCHRSHHHHSAVSALSHRPLSSFPITVRRPIMCVIVVRHPCRHHPPP